MKSDTEANWNLAVNFIPLAGEVIIYKEDSTYTYPRMKIGDGTRTVTALPFIDNALRTSLLEEIGIVDNKIDTLVGDSTVSDQINNALTNNVITIEEINAICGTVIYSADEVEL